MPINLLAGRSTKIHVNGDRSPMFLNDHIKYKIIFLAKLCSKCIKYVLFTIVIHTTWLMCWICSWDSVILTMFPESCKYIYRELLFPHEDMFLLLFPECFKIHTLESFHWRFPFPQEDMFQFLYWPNDKMLKKIISTISD